MSMTYRVALLSDIHGNLVSLRAVLADLHRRGYDQMVCLGDVAANGPQPAACIETLAALAPLTVMGNADEWLLDPQPKSDPTDFQRKVEASDYWTIERLSPERLDFLRSFQPTRRVDTPTPLLAFHATPRSNTEIVLPTTPLDEIGPLFAPYPEPLLAGGHTHQPFVRRIHTQTFLNPGSVGMPYCVARDGRSYNPAWAEYALLEWESDGQLQINLRRVPVDSDAIRAAILTSGMPYAETWAEGWAEG